MVRRRGFTLVELVVIILILGILAGVAAPKMFNTSSSATDNGLKQTLSIIRDAIELYSAQNGGQYPPCTGTGTDFRDELKNFIRGPFPKCPVGPANNNLVLPSTADPFVGDASPDEGWSFNTATGQFICGFNGMSNTGVTYDAF